MNKANVICNGFVIACAIVFVACCIIIMSTLGSFEHPALPVPAPTPTPIIR